MIKILEYEKVDSSKIFSRVEPKMDVSSIVSNILADVKDRGDQALLEYCEKFDKVKLKTLTITEEEIEKAFNCVEPEFIKIIQKAKENITFFHKNHLFSLTP